MPLPTGTLTFLFTDIEGSTKLVQSLGERFASLLSDHHRLLREVFASSGGVEFGTEGDALFVVFQSAVEAVEAAAEAQLTLERHQWTDGAEVKVRMGLHTGEGRLVGDNYSGIDVHRAARIASSAHGGQIVLSESTRALVGTALPESIRFKDLGEHRLKDLEHPEHLFQACVDGLRTDFPPPRSLGAHPNNLPVPLSTFISRDREVAEIIALLTDNRMVTLTGPGGTGKTRLSIAAAAKLLDRFGDGAFFVRLAPVGDPRLVPATIAEVLGVREQRMQPIERTLRSYLSDKEILLILDNFEQILPAAATVADLLSGAPKLRVLATSRAALRIYGEQEYPIPPMSLPDPERLPPPEALTAYEAVSLFVSRAQAVKPRFELNAANAAAVAEICARLDGLPLAIELAAARLKVFAPHDILARLEDGLGLLTGGARDLAQRQQTLRDAIAWSYRLLDGPTQVFFRRLGVLVGGWSFGAAEAVVNPEGELGVDSLDALTVLIDNSLVRRYDTDDGDTRFRMLQTIREYALMEARSADDWPDLQERFATFFLDLAETAGPVLTTDDKWLEVLAIEMDNIRSVFRWTIDNRRTEVGIRMGRALWRFWQVRAHLGEGRTWMTELLDQHVVRDALRAKGLMAIGSLAYWQSDFGASADYYREGLDIFRELGDRAGTAEALYNNAFSSLIAKDYPEARRLYELSRSVYLELDDAKGMASVAWGLAMAALGERNLDEALLLGTETRERFHALGDWFGTALADYVFLQVARLGNDYDEAHRLMLLHIADAQRTQDEVTIASYLDLLADIELARGYPVRALCFARVANGMKEAVGGQAPPSMLFISGDIEELARSSLSQEEIDEALTRAAGMTSEEAIAYALKDPDER